MLLKSYTAVLVSMQDEQCICLCAQLITVLTPFLIKQNLSESRQAKVMQNPNMGLMSHAI